MNHLPFNLIHDDISLADITARNTAHLRSFIAASSSLDGFELAAYVVAIRIEIFENECMGDLAVNFDTKDSGQFLSADLQAVERPFKQFWLGTPAFEKCVTAVARQFDLFPEDL